MVVPLEDGERVIDLSPQAVHIVKTAANKDEQGLLGIECAASIVLQGLALRGGIARAIDAVETLAVRITRALHSGSENARTIW